jgi:hypothetical protein
MRTVSATQPGRALTFTLEQGDVSLVSQVEAAIERVEWATGERVETVGVDRGALSQEVLEAFNGSDTGLAVWADDTTVLRRAVAAVPRSAFVDGEYETIRRPDGKKVQRLKTRLADVPEMVINGRGYCCRTVIVEDMRDGHRAAFHAVGKPADRQSAKELLAFLRGKQWAEEDFKQGRAWGSDAFCGGEITPQLRREKPTEAEIEELLAHAPETEGTLAGQPGQGRGGVGPMADWQAGQTAIERPHGSVPGFHPSGPTRYPGAVGTVHGADSRRGGYCRAWWGRQGAGTPIHSAEKVSVDYQPFQERLEISEGIGGRLFPISRRLSLR